MRTEIMGVGFDDLTLDEAAQRAAGMIDEGGFHYVVTPNPELVDRARYVTGLADQVDGATAGLPCHHIEKIGRSKTVTVLLPEGEDLNPGYDVTVQPVNLQKLFVALCGEEVHL